MLCWTFPSLFYLDARWLLPIWKHCNIAVIRERPISTQGRWSKIPSSSVFLCSLSLCLSLSPGMCAFAAFHFISFHCNSQRGSRRKGSKVGKKSPRRGKLTEVRAAASAARQGQGDTSLAGAPLLLQSIVASLLCSRTLRGSDAVETSTAVASYSYFVYADSFKFNASKTQFIGGGGASLCR